MSRLIVINGPPGIGKSTLARRLASDHRLMLLIDIDEIRTSMGGWESHPESKLLARRVGLEMARAHLRSGHDVVVPQLLGRAEFLEALAEVAATSESTFHEVLLVASEQDALVRLKARRAELARTTAPHPLRAMAIGQTQLEGNMAALRSIAASRPGTKIIETTAGDEDGAYGALTAALLQT